MPPLRRASMACRARSAWYVSTPSAPSVCGETCGSIGGTGCRSSPCPETAGRIGKTVTSVVGRVDFWCILFGRSVRSAATDQVRRGRDHPLAMPEQPFGVAADEVELMLAAFLAHRLDVLYGMCARHLRDELREQMRFGSRSLQHLIAEEHQFLEHHLLRAKHELERALVQPGGFHFCICDCWERARSDPLRQF